MSASGMKERNLDAGRKFRTFEMKRKLSFDHDKANFVNAQANSQINNRTSESSGLLESSSVFDKDSRSQTATGTPKSSRNNTKSYCITEAASKRQNCTANQLATIESTLHHLLKSQNSIGVVLNTLIYNFSDFLVQFQTKKSGSKFSEQPNVSKTSLSYQKSNNYATTFGSLDVDFPKIETTLKNLLSQIELVAKETTSKLDQYETFLRSRDEKSILEVNNCEELVENKIRSQLFNQKTCSWTVNKTPDQGSDPLQTKDVKRPSQNFAKNENTENSLISFRKNSEIFNGIEIVSAARDDFQDSNKSVVHQTPIRQSNRVESPRSSSQQTSDLPQTPLGLRPSATFGVLNLPEKTESFPTQPMRLTTNFPNTSKESLSHAVKLRQMESNRSKKADLDLVISKRQDESRLGQASVFIKKDKPEMIIHTARDQILESNYLTTTKDIATGILSSPCNDRETGNFTSRTIPDDFHYTRHVVRKLKIKPGMNELPQKDLSELSFPDDSDEYSPKELDPEENQKKHSNIDQQATEESLNSIAKKEKTIIKSLMKAQYGQDHTSYHKAEQGRMLQRKYLISSKWWCRWKEFVNFDAKETANNEKIASFFKSHVYKRPGSITNTDLVREENLKDSQSLEYDLDLKPNLLEHHDFEAVSKEIFEIFVTWYGCDYEIYRVLKPDPFHDNKLFLDLYPKKKFKRNQQSRSTGPTRPKVENAGL